jgi:hypothetical protein
MGVAQDGVGYAEDEARLSLHQRFEFRFLVAGQPCGLRDLRGAFIR